MSSTQVIQFGVQPSTASEASNSAAPLTLTVEQAAQRLGISRSTAYECVRSGSLPSLRFRRRIVIPTVVVERLLAGGLDAQQLDVAAS